MSFVFPVTTYVLTYEYIFLNMSKIQRYLLKISNSTYQVVMSDKEEHHSDSDSDMAECLKGLANESSGIYCN